MEGVDSETIGTAFETTDNNHLSELEIRNRELRCIIKNLKDKIEHIKDLLDN